MSGKIQNMIRSTLRRKDDGMTLTDICRAIEVPDSSALKALKAMPDAYIDRWTPAQSGSKQWAAVWCVVRPPENCPRPE